MSHSNIQEVTLSDLSEERNLHSDVLDFLTFFLFFYLAILQILGISKNLTEISVSATFTLAVLLSIIIIFRRQERTFASEFLDIKSTLKSTRETLSGKLSLILILVITSGLLVVALKMSANNWDSMTYHLPRIEHWLQNNSFWFYETNVERQLWLQSLNSQFMLIPRSLGLPGVTLNLIQLSCYMFILYISFRILYLAKIESNLLVAIILLIASIPNLVVQAPTTQSDVVAAFTVLLNFYYLFTLYTRELNTTNLIFWAMTFAISISSKGTVYPYLLLSGVAVLALVIRRAPKKFIVISTVLPFTLLLNGFMWWQSYRKFGSLSGPKSTPDRFIQDPISSGFTFTDFISSTVHFFVNNLQTVFPVWNQSIFSLAFKLSEILGLNLLSEANSWPNWNGGKSFTYIFNPSFGLNEDSATSPILSLLLIALAIISISAIRKKSFFNIAYIWVVSVYFFSTIVFLRWNPFVSRYYIAIAVLALVASALWWRNQRIFTSVATSLALLCGIYAMPFVFLSEKRSVFGPKSNITKPAIEQLFYGRENLLNDYRLLEDYIIETKPTSLELGIKGDDWEYPIWLAARKAGLEVYHYREIESKKGNSPLLVCYTVCLDSIHRSHTFIFNKPISEELRKSEKVNFNQSYNSNVLIEGWGEIENWGVWSIDYNASLRFRLEPDALENSDLVIQARSMLAETQIRFVRIFINDVFYKVIDLNKIGVNSGLIVGNNFLKELSNPEELRIKFKFDNLLSPKSLGFSADERLLGLGIYSLALLPRQ